MKHLLTIVASFIAAQCLAQKENVYFLRNTGKYVEVRDSADYMRIVREPDSASNLYNVFEFYMNGKRKLVGKSATVDPPRYEGQCITYFPSGIKRGLANFVKGARVGSEYSFFPNGKPYLIKEFTADNQPDSYFRDYSITACYDSLGTTLVENGSGYAKMYDGDFKGITEEGAVKNGRRDGDWKGTDKKQGADFAENYSNGKLTSGTAKYADGSTTTYTGSRTTSPQFKGGTAAFGQYLGDNIRYPDYERRNDIHGRVILSFVVEKDGSVSDIKVSKSVSPGLDNEALRVIKKSAHWVPGTVYGKPVRVVYSVPVNFQLQN